MKSDSENKPMSMCYGDRLMDRVLQRVSATCAKALGLEGAQHI